jgi:hypothetical protein
VRLEADGSESLNINYCAIPYFTANCIHRDDKSSINYYIRNYRKVQTGFSLSITYEDFIRGWYEVAVMNNTAAGKSS